MRFLEIWYGYLKSSNDWAVRIRIEDNKKAWLTLKAKAKQFTNHEFEYKIPINDAYSIWELVPSKILKVRYPLNIQDGSWIVDCFLEDNYPLVIAEVELSSEKTFVEQPSWCWKEITNEYKLSNGALSKAPISGWSIKNRQELKHC